MTRILCAIILALSAGASAATFEGVLHNNQLERRASLNAYGKLYWLDFRSPDLYDLAERYDRERVVVSGTVSYPRHESRPVIYVDSINFRPYERRVESVVPIERRYYTRYRRPVVRERTTIYEYR